MARNSVSRSGGKKRHKNAAAGVVENKVISIALFDFYCTLGTCPMLHLVWYLIAGCREETAERSTGQRQCGETTCCGAWTWPDIRNTMLGGDGKVQIIAFRVGIILIFFVHDILPLQHFCFIILQRNITYHAIHNFGCGNCRRLPVQPIHSIVSGSCTSNVYSFWL